jgi:DNA-binding NtrC family response regulator
MAVVLITEDDEAVRVLAESIIQDAGHTTLTAAKPAEAVALLSGEHAVDLLVTDLEMDGNELAGTELAQEARRIRPEVSVLYTSAGGVTDGTRALFVDRSEFLPKPYTAALLVDAVQKALGEGG